MALLAIEMAQVRNGAVEHNSDQLENSEILP
jgi:hypothetical protein